MIVRYVTPFLPYIYIYIYKSLYIWTHKKRPSFIFFKLVVGTFRDLMMSHDALELGSVACHCHLNSQLSSWTLSNMFLLLFWIWFAIHNLQLAYQQNRGKEVRIIIRYESLSNILIVILSCYIFEGISWHDQGWNKPSLAHSYVFLSPWMIQLLAFVLVGTNSSS